MPPAIEPMIRKKVISLYLQGYGRNEISRSENLGQGTVTSIIQEFKRGTEEGDYDMVRNLAIHVEKEGLGTMADFRVALRLKNYLTCIGDIGDKEEQQIEQLIANISTSPNPTELIATANRIAEISDIPLSELEERVRVLKCEKEALERAIEEGRTIIESVNIDRKMVEDYKVMNAELEKCGVGPQEPRKFHNLLRVLRMNNYDYAKILNTFADIDDVRKLRLEVDNEWRILRARLEQVKDTLPFAEQLLQYGVGISEVLAFMLAVDEKADMENIPRGASAYKVIEEIRDYSQLGRPEERTGETATTDLYVEHDYDN